MTNKLPSFLGSGGWTRRGLHYLDLDMPDAPLNLSDRESRADADGDDDDDDDDDDDQARSPLPRPRHAGRAAQPL